MQRALQSTMAARLSLVRRSLSTAASSAAAPPPLTWRESLLKRKNGLVQIFLAGTAMTMAMHSVNLRNRGDEVEADLTKRLHASVAARQALIHNAPAIAREMGLPATAEGNMRRALEDLDMQYSNVTAASAPKTPVATPAVATPTSTSKPASGGARATQGAGRLVNKLVLLLLDVGVGVRRDEMMVRERQARERVFSDLKLF